MEFDLAIAKLASLYALVNFIIAFTGFVSVVAFDALIGLTITFLLVLTVPVAVQHAYLSQKRAARKA